MSGDLKVTTAVIWFGAGLHCQAWSIPGFTGCNTLDFIDMYLCVCMFEKAVMLGIILEFHSL